MRSLYTYSFLALTCTAVAGAQIVLDPSPARVLGHPSTTPAEQLMTTNLNPNFSVNGGLYSPQGVALDTTVSPPILYVADTLNNRILAWQNATSAMLTNVQPPGLIIGQPDPYTTLPATNGGLFSPRGLVVDAQGNVYVADTGNNRVLRYPSPFANSTKVPGSSTVVDNKADIVIGQPDMFTSRSPNQGGSVSAKTLHLNLGIATYTAALAMDASGNLYVADAGNQRVLQYTAASLTPGSSGQIAAAIAIGQAGFTAIARPSNQYDRSTFYLPAGMAFDSAGRLFVSDDYGSRLMVFTPPFSTGMAAARLAGIVSPTPSTPTSSTLYNPEGLVMINNGPAVVDSGGNRLLIFDAYTSKDWGVATGDTTFANPPPVALAVLGQGSNLTDFSSIAVNDGNPQASFSDNGAKIATFNSPVAAAVAGNGDLFVADTGNNRVLVYPNAGTVAAAAVVLGQSDFPYNSPNSIHGREFFFGSPSSSSYDAGLAVDSSTSTPRLYVSDPNNHRVLGFADARKVGPGVQADIVIGEPDMATAVCNFGGVVNTPGTEPLPRQPTNASLCYPTGLAVDPASGDLYVADSDNGRVLRFPAPFAAANSSQQANLVLGQAGFTGVSNAKASQSVMVVPYGLVFDPLRGLLVSDVSANRVLLFSITASTANGEPAKTVIGQSNFGSTSNTVLNAPHHIAEDTIGRLYVADSGHGQITIFGIPSGTATNTPIGSFPGLNYPEAVWDNQNPVVGLPDDIWVGDSNNGLSRYTALPLTGATTETPTLTMQAVEVTGPNLACGASLCGYPAIAIAQDSFGALYVADTSNRVAIHYPALAGTNGASFVCAMGCNLTTPPDPTYYLAPGAYGTLYRFNGLSFAASTTTNQPPFTMSGVQVLVDGQPSPITYASSGQINFVLPYEAPTSGTTTVTVVDASTSQVLGSGSAFMNVTAPAFFIHNQTAKSTPLPGQALPGQIAALNCNTIVNGSCDDAVNGTSNPANPGTYIQLYLTGQGQVSGAPPDGQGDCSAAPQTGAKPLVLIGTSIATVQYSGLAPCFIGMWQINVKIPDVASLGNIPGFDPGVFPVLVYYENFYSNTQANNQNPHLATTIAINAPQ